MEKNDDHTIDFLFACARNGAKRAEQDSASICKVSRVLRDLSPCSFTPQLVSIGPLHRQNEKLQELEWMKEAYLDDLLYRSEHPDRKRTLEACLQKVNTSVDRIRKSYAGMTKNYTDVELAKMMVIDGCFILEFCLKHQKEADEQPPNQMQNNYIAMDLILLENQIPFFVLEDLFDSTLGGDDQSLSDLLDTYLAPYINLFHSLPPEDFSNPDSTHDHVLGYLHRGYKLVYDKQSNSINDDGYAKKKQKKNTDKAYHSIAELYRSGVKFKKHKESDWSMTIKFKPPLFSCFPWFWGKPTLLLPTLVIDDITEVILRNFIAYEQSFPQNPYYFTSYASAMQRLIDNQEDISKLVESKVLINNLGTNQEAADMINQICKHISFTKFYYDQEFKEMDIYYNGYWPKNIARLKRTYFNNPWNVIAAIGALILFSLTVVQTIFTIMAA